MRAWLSLALLGQAVCASAQAVRVVPVLEPGVSASAMAGGSMLWTGLSPRPSPSLSLPFPAPGLGPTAVLPQTPRPVIQAETSMRAGKAGSSVSARLGEPARPAGAGAAQADPGAARPVRVEAREAGRGPAAVGVSDPAARHGPAIRSGVRGIRPAAGPARSPSVRSKVSAALSALKGLVGRVGAAAEGPLAQAFDGAAAFPSLDAAITDARASKKTRPGKRVRLDKIDTEDTGKFDKDEKEKALKRLREDQERLDELQQMLYSRKDKAVLIILQGMDTSGKDGTIRHVLAAMTPQGFKVVSFKKPTAEEARRHYLWRVKKALPEKGFIGVFNRSHYEDILVPSVYKTLPPEQVESRFDEINAFEKRLVDSGVTVVKFFLHISKDEQKARLRERLENPDKQWKFSPEDLKSRERWDDFQRTYESILERTDTPWAPWHVIPADRKWYRNYLVGRILRETMERMGLSFPRPAEGLDTVVIPD